MTSTTYTDQIELILEEVEEVIAPGVQLNHNETLVGDISY